ncbi:MAG TPA: hypothetical protein VGB07_14270 [Blastocatellia bacterium]
MNRRSIFFSVVLLAALSLPALPQTKSKNRTAKPGGKPVTVTLVRWPYI